MEYLKARRRNFCFIVPLLHKCKDFLKSLQYFKGVKIFLIFSDDHNPSNPRRTCKSLQIWSLSLNKLAKLRRCINWVCFRSKKFFAQIFLENSKEILFWLYFVNPRIQIYDTFKSTFESCWSYLSENIRTLHECLETLRYLQSGSLKVSPNIR